MAQTKTQAKKTAKHDSMVAAEIGAGIAAVAGAAAAAGYFFYGSKEASGNRKRTAKWAGELKDKVVKETKKQAKVVEKLDKKAVAIIVDRASKAYEGVRNVKREDLVAAANELKQNWKEIQAELSSAAKKAGTAAKSATKTATKSAVKAAKKAPAKKVAKK